MGRPSLVGTDLAVLEARETRKDLPCTVTPGKALLGFDLKFHAGYDLVVPLRELAGPDNILTILFRIAPVGQPEEATYFTQKFNVPSIDEDAKGEAFLQGSFDLGEGKYQVDWLMRDRLERVCSTSWETEALLSPKDKALAVTLPPRAVAQADREQFSDEPITPRDSDSDLVNVKLLVNFAPQNAAASSLQPVDTIALVSILRSLQRDTRIAKFSLVAFNLQEHKILYRQLQAERIDFPAIGEAVKKLQLGRVDVGRLAEKNADGEFLADLIRTEMTASDRPDALIFAGPKVMLQDGIPADSLRLPGEPEFPVFYMNYNLYPQVSPWRDAIGQAVKIYKGQEYTISRPRDLFFAVTEVVSRIVRSKSGKRATSAALR